MTKLRVLPCSKHHVPKVTQGTSLWSVTCERCRGLYALGRTEEDAIRCWNNARERGE